MVHGVQYNELPLHNLLESGGACLITGPGVALFGGLGFGDGGHGSGVHYFHGSRGSGIHYFHGGCRCGAH